VTKICLTRNFFLSAWCLTSVTAMVSGTAAMSQSRTVRERNQITSQAAPQGMGSNLPETRRLINNKQLLPTLNRTQAMRLEAETGHLTPAEDAVLKNKRSDVLSPAQASVIRAAHSHSHATVKPRVKYYK
jgi:hypothetical protein